jgi:hypothetical protein
MFYIGRSDKTPKALPDLLWLNLVSEMEWEDVTGLGNLAAGNNVSVKGLLFKTTGAPTLLAKAVHKQ